MDGPTTGNPGTQVFFPKVNPCRCVVAWKNGYPASIEREYRLVPHGLAGGSRTEKSRDTGLSASPKAIRWRPGPDGGSLESQADPMMSLTICILASNQ
jgi:hypothetical protein